MSTAQGERRLRLAATRSLLYSLPANELFELPGRPHVVYQLRSYSHTGNTEEAVLQARSDSPFLFKAFETGQIGPKRLARMHGDKPRIATIHEYLDWTVTAQAAEGDDELDFGGFRVLVILPRYRSGWPPPGGDALDTIEPGKPRAMGPPYSPLPVLQSHGRPVTAATIRSGPGYLEIPFVATHENKRGRGYCRCLVEAIEEIARTLGLPKLMLCSTNDAAVQSTWRHLGFEYASDEAMEQWDILHTDLVYLQNTTQMHKDVPPPRRIRSVVIKHDMFRQRSYAFVGHKRAQRPASTALAGAPPASRPRLNSRRSEATSRDESLSVSAREQARGAAAVASHGAACSSGSRPLAADVSPVAALGHPLAAAVAAPVPQLTASLAPRFALHADELHHRAALGMRDEAIASGGPPTPQPADAGTSRALHAHTLLGAASTSQVDASWLERPSAAGLGTGAQRAWRPGQGAGEGLSVSGSLGMGHLLPPWPGPGLLEGQDLGPRPALGGADVHGLYCGASGMLGLGLPGMALLGGGGLSRHDTLLRAPMHPGELAPGADLAPLLWQAGGPCQLPQQQAGGGGRAGLSRSSMAAAGMRLGQPASSLSRLGDGQLGALQPGVLQPGLLQPGVLQPGLLQPGLVQPGLAQSGVLQPGLAQSGVLQPGLAQSGVLQPGLAQSGVLQPGLAHSGVMQPGLLQPGLAQSGVLQLGLLQPGLAQSGVLQPGLAQPGVLQPGFHSSTFPFPTMPF